MDAGGMIIAPEALEGRHVRLEPVRGEGGGAVRDELREEMREALNRDPDNWAIQSVSGMGEHFAEYWRLMVETPGRIAFAVRDAASGALAGTSSLFDISPQHRTLEIGYTWLRPEYRGTLVNPEAKLLMLGHAFAAGALRVQFSVNALNARSRAAVLKLGACQEGIIRRHRITWTGAKRDTVLFSIIDEEWPGVRAGLEARLAG
jgi:RimJ/RimL family protein N-acetyltransferase